MEITRENYESFFVDYLEGNIDKNIIDEFIEFLQKNPDLRAELEAFKSVLPAEEIVSFPGKEKLYKEVFDSQKAFNQASVAILENDSTQEETRKFNRYLESHPDRIKEFEQFRNTKLQPDESIVFKRKNNLYRNNKIRQIFWVFCRVAAVLLIVFSFSVLLKQNSEIIPTKQVAKITLKEKDIRETPVPAAKVKPEKKKDELKPIAKDTIKNKSDKSIREKNRGRMEEVASVISRETESLLPIAAVGATLQSNEQYLDLALIEERYIIPSLPSDSPDEKPLLAEVVKEKTGLRGLNLGKIAKAGLAFFSDITKNKFSYKTDKQGEITELELDTRLLAFTIPTGGGAE